MISGTHLIVFSKDVEADRAFFRDVLGFQSADAGGGWLIFALPPSELAVHPGDDSQHVLYLMCEDLKETMEQLRRRGVEVSREVVERDWGLIVEIRLPSGSALHLYEPRHPSPPST